MHFHIFLFFMLFPAISNAQYNISNSFKSKRHEINFGLGVSNCLTDVGGNGSKTNLNIKKTNFTSNFSHLYYFKSKIAFRTSLTYAKVSGDDSYSSNFFKKNRALNFNTTISELSGILEFTTTTIKNGNKNNPKNKRGKNISKKDRLGFGSYILQGLEVFITILWEQINFLTLKVITLEMDRNIRLENFTRKDKGLMAVQTNFQKKLLGKNILPTKILHFVFL